MKTLTITNEQGLAFEARLLQTGDRYGLDDCLVWDEAKSKHGLGGPLVEFWVQNRFISRYLFSTLKEDHPHGYGLNLEGSVDEWSITWENLQDVLIAFSPKRIEETHRIEGTDLSVRLKTRFPACSFEESAIKIVDISMLQDDEPGDAFIKLGAFGVECRPGNITIAVSEDRGIIGMDLVGMLGIDTDAKLLFSDKQLLEVVEQKVRRFCVDHFKPRRIHIIEPLADDLTLHIETSEVKPDKPGEIVLNVTITDKDGLILGCGSGEHATITLVAAGCLNIFPIDNLNIDMDGTPLSSNRELHTLVEEDIRMIWSSIFSNVKKEWVPQ